MKHILVFLSLILTACSNTDNSQTIVPSNWNFFTNIYPNNYENDLILNGDIKELIIKTYSFNEKFGEKVFTYIDVTILKFKDGYLIEGHEGEYSTYRKYNDMSQLILQKNYDEGEESGIDEFEYDDLVRLKLFKNYSDGEHLSTTEIVYDDNSREVVRNRFYNDYKNFEEPYGIDENEYDENGNLIKEYTSWDNKLRSLYVNEYDNKNIRTSRSRYNEEGELTSKTVYEYFDNNEYHEIYYYRESIRKEIIITDDFGRVIRYSNDDENLAYEYIFDEKNNVIEMMTYKNDLKSKGAKQEITIIYN